MYGKSRRSGEIVCQCSAGNRQILWIGLADLRIRTSRSGAIRDALRSTFALFCDEGDDGSSRFRCSHKEKKVSIMSQMERNKQAAKDLYTMMFNDCKPREAADLFIGDEYIQHNPHVGNGKDAFVEYFERMTREYPGKKVHIKRAFAEDNYVILHCHQEWPGDNDYAGIDIFRFDDNGKIVEHWDVLQIVPPESANGNSMF